MVHRVIGADAASDVWEPLLRDLLELVDKYRPVCGNPGCLVCQREDPIVARAKEALS